MGLPVRLHQLPGRLAAGALILQSGLSKRDSDEQSEAGLHSLAAGTYPFLSSLDPRSFTKALSTGEIVLGTALLLPLVPSGLAGAGLAAFSAGLLGLYLRTPGMHELGSLTPTPQGMTIAKDACLFGIGAGLVLEALTGGGRDRTD